VIAAVPGPFTTAADKAPVLETRVKPPGIAVVFVNEVHVVQVTNGLENPVVVATANTVPVPAAHDIAGGEPAEKGQVTVAVPNLSVSVNVVDPDATEGTPVITPVVGLRDKAAGKEVPPVTAKLRGAAPAPFNWAV
jgi:hypothetical protein